MSMLNDNGKKLARKGRLKDGWNLWVYLSPILSVLGARRLVAPDQRQIFLPAK